MQLEQLGPYKIGRQLGRGGMGTVFAGTDVATNQPVAVKVLSVALSRDEGFRDRFELEVETLRKLRHENIVRLFGFGEEHGVLYYAMEMVDGISLEEYLHSGKRFAWPDACKLVIPLCGALKHAHDRGIVHRDIKPANLLITRDGALKLADFGIAKLFGATGMTSAGGAIGTAEFMAPEQADGRHVSHRSDLYSLGAVFYAMLAGRPPFIAKSVLEMLQLQRFAQPEPLRRYVADLPEEIDSIVLQLLEKDPERRPPNATLLARRLEATALGLSMRKQRAGDGDFDLGSSTRGDSLGSPATNLGETRLATAHPPAAEGSQAGLVAVTQLTDALRGVPAAGAEKPAPSTRFTAVGEEEEEEVERERQPFFSPQAIVLIVLSLLVFAAVYYFLQPPNADRLYAQITESVAAGEDGLLDAEPDIQSFLQYHPTDKRVRELERYQEDIEMVRLGRKFQTRVRRQSGVEGLSPPEIAYHEAMVLMNTDPAGSVDRLRALLDLYENDSQLTRDGQLCVRLARMQLARHEPRSRRHADEQLKSIAGRLAAAAQIEQSDLPKARRMWQAIVALYGDDAWAAAAVQTARDKLDATAQLVAPSDDPAAADPIAPASPLAPAEAATSPPTAANPAPAAPATAKPNASKDS
ncbi:MAG: serine/threonine protein kinase [Planctomycetia bacterium]|nr:serine/threonine protein kinase [Planctomycetia bacterium]